MFLHTPNIMLSANVTEIINQLDYDMKARHSLLSLCTLLGILLIGLNFSFASENTAAIEKSAQSDIEKTNVGNIIFTKSPLSTKDVNEIDTISTLDLNNDKNFYFTGFLGKPLTSYLQELAPDLTPKTLNEQGNFQFTFYVNNTLVYSENLNVGAGFASDKSTNIVLTRPFFSERNEDSWGRYLWMRFMHFGGEEALPEGQHELKIEMRSYLEREQITVGDLIASGKVLIDVIKPPVTEAQIAVQAIREGSAWEISKDTFNKETIRALNKKIAQEDFKQISSIVVIKDGALLLEQYFNSNNRDSLHDPRSVGKSFASSALGIAIDEGHIANEGAKLSEFYPLQNFDNYSVRKANVSLKELLSMNSAFDGDDTQQDSVGNEENMYPTSDWVKFTLDLPMRAKSPTNEPWTYFTAGAMLLGDIVHNSVPGGLEAYAHKKLFAPLGIEHYEWQHTPQKVANTAGGLALRSLDFAKYGQLYKDGGVWKGKQIISQKWVEASLAKQVARTDNPNGGHYGYLFWHDVIPFEDKLLEVAYATGNGGNKIYIFKNIPFVIVITATAYNRPYAHPQVNQMMGQYILPAILGKTSP
jgi:CubicO group peptidase (beta-lactamase class C family)